ncbi:MAG: cell division protein FtsW [Paenibacillaceae bacterium ZCTH02-B3]|nr:MAG: cell division protein FtsW [Paenibacillaceae bacterium ZCTH02-B3]
MNAPATGRRGTPDFLLLILTLILVGFGIVMVFSASSSMTAVMERFGNDPLYFTRRQLMFAGVGTVMMLILMNIRYERYKVWFAPFLLVTLVLLVAVLFTGEINGARSWIVVGPFSIQPTEFAKIALILYLAAIISRKQEKFREFKRGLLPALLVPGLVAGLILVQPDPGSAAVLVAAVAVILVVGGANLLHVALTGLALAGAGGLALGVYMLLNPGFDGGFRMSRLTAFRDPFADAQGAGYQLLRSLEAFGHGGLTGTGLGNSVQKLFYLPYAYNDFIYAVIAEELGFIGASLFILFYLFFLWRMLVVALRCPDLFGTLFGVGMVTLVAVQALVNMGGVSGAIPITGVTLPFVSYGGSSLLSLMMGMGVLLSISREYNRLQGQEKSL